jgi:hypothetical protein
MKNYKVFILISLSSISTVSLACSFYPYGEDIRYCMLNPGHFNYHQFSSFYYSSTLFPPLMEYQSEVDEESRNYMTPSLIYAYPNVLLWKERCKGKPADDHIYSALYGNDALILNASSSNEFVRYLYSNNDVAAIDYLKFARDCSKLNTFISDPWERGNGKHAGRTRLIGVAFEKIKKSRDQDLKNRYAFLIIRLAYYNHDPQLLKQVYKDHFQKGRRKTIIDYWAMYFNTLYLEDGAYKNYQAALVFANAPDKRFAIHDNYDKNMPVSSTLKHAKTNKEKAAIWLLSGIRTHGKALTSIKNIYLLDPKFYGWEFLLLREINKLEDWIYTPYYTNFEPSVRRNNIHRYSIFEQRITEDRAYAANLLAFVDTIAPDNVRDPGFLKIAKAYLHHMTGGSDIAAGQLEALEKNFSVNQELKKQVQLLKAIVTIAARKPGEAVIQDHVQFIIKREAASKNQKFLFAIAKELEINGNTTDAAFIFSKVNGEYDDTRVPWRTRKFHYTSYDDTYDNYFYYMDAAYTENEIQQLITKTESKAAKSSFEKWKIKEIKKEIPRLYELLGTKYLRKNKLEKALACYKKVNDTLWSSGDHAIYSYYMNSNPFANNFYNGHGKNEADTIRYNKETLLKELLRYLRLAENKQNPKRDYYYFLVANCYLNMTYYGNSWAMRRYYWSGSPHWSKLEDDNEYFGCLIAKSYYLKAKQVSKSKKFAALCLRMAGSCEKNRLISDLILNDKASRWDNFADTLFVQNKYYSRLRKEYPSYYEELTSSCDSFSDYFSARR